MKKITALVLLLSLFVFVIGFNVLANDESVPDTEEEDESAEIIEPDDGKPSDDEITETEMFNAALGKQYYSICVGAFNPYNLDWLDKANPSNHGGNIDGYIGEQIYLLTDGDDAADDLLRRGKWLGLHSAGYGYDKTELELVLDLETQVYDIEEFTVYLYNDVINAVLYPNKIEVYTSDGDGDFTMAGSVYMDFTEKTESKSVTVPSSVSSARYVKFVFSKNAPWTFLSEIGVWSSGENNTVIGENTDVPEDGGDGAPAEKDQSYIYDALSSDGQKNISIGKKYDCVCVGAFNTYTFDWLDRANLTNQGGNVDSYYGDQIYLLTDGDYAADDLLRRGKWLGLNSEGYGYDRDELELVLDLGSTENGIKSFTAFVYNDYKNRIAYPDKIEVFTSDDNVGFVSAGSVFVGGSGDDEAKLVTIESSVSSARYVKFVFSKNAAWVFLSEIGVWGRTDNR